MDAKQANNLKPGDKIYRIRRDHKGDSYLESTTVKSVTDTKVGFICRSAATHHQLFLTKIRMEALWPTPREAIEDAKRLSLDQIHGLHMQIELLKKDIEWFEIVLNSDDIEKALSKC